MDRRNGNRIFRETLSAIIRSKLSSRDLRQLSDLLLSGGSFSYELGKAVFDLSHTIDAQGDFAWPEEVELDEIAADEGLVELVYRIVQRRRLPKRELIRLMNDAAPRSVKAIGEVDLSTKKLLQLFFEVSSTQQTQRFLRGLGMDVEQDPYLGGITDRSKR